MTDRPMHAATARLAAWAVLALFCALGWAGQVGPSADGAALLSVLGGLALGAGLVRARTSVRAAVRRAAVPVALLGAVVLAFLVGGVEVRLLVPDRWDDLAAGVGRGLESLPDARIPYEGPEGWVRSVIVLGGALLVGLSAIAATVRAPGHGPPVLAAVLLGVLYVVPAVEEPPGSPWLAGGVLSLLLVAFLWADRLRPGQLRTAGLLAGTGILVAVALAPRLDRAEPIVDYEQLVADGFASGETTRFDWSHDYGPLEWSRDGREVLRVSARTASYWKATVLNEFDGAAWVPGRRLDPRVPDSEISPRRRFRDRVEVVVGDLETSDYVGAGTILGVDRSPRLAIAAGSGTFRTGSRPLRKGDTYTADVYVPRPGASRLRRAGTDFPESTRAFLTMGLPAQAPRPGAPPARPDAEILFPFWGSDEPTYAIFGRTTADTSGVERVESSPYARTYALAQRLRAASSDPYDFARRVRARVQQDATYTETPAPRRHPLDAFLFDAREGYCQQFSGAMALLLRMGGVPARVASGFTTGTRDENGDQWVVRDVDAHSWVEAYFPGEGWVTFDPTPEVAPPRSQLLDDEDDPDAVEEDAQEDDEADQEPEPAADPASGGPGDDPSARDGGGVPWRLVVPAVLLLLGAGVLTVRARRASQVVSVDAALADLRRALRRAGRPPGDGETLRTLEDGFPGEDEARAYLAALRLARYAPDGVDGRVRVPGPAGRRALRRALAAGGGPTARLRAWWAVPPRWPAGPSARSGGARPGTGVHSSSSHV